MRGSRHTIAACLLAFALIGCQPTSQPLGTERDADGLGIASFDAAGNLQRPDVTEWVFMGSTLGLGYVRGEFRNDRPGTFQIVHMEPAAYHYFQEHGEYADGTMFSLSFYEIQEKPEPALNGFAQDQLVSFEIHLLDKTRFEEQRAFYLFQNEARQATMVPPGNECTECHLEHGQYDGTFTQFYPPLAQHRQSQQGNQP